MKKSENGNFDIDTDSGVYIYNKDSGDIIYKAQKTWIDGIDSKTVLDKILTFIDFLYDEAELTQENIVNVPIPEDIKMEKREIEKLINLLNNNGCLLIRLESESRGKNFPPVRIAHQLPVIDDPYYHIGRVMLNLYPSTLKYVSDYIYRKKGLEGPLLISRGTIRQGDTVYYPGKSTPQGKVLGVLIRSTRKIDNKYNFKVDLNYIKHSMDESGEELSIEEIKKAIASIRKSLKNNKIDGLELPIRGGVVRIIER